MSTRKATAANGIASGLIGSALLHLGIFVATIFVWTHTLDIADQPSHVVPVDLVTVAEQTNVAPMATQTLPPPPQPDMIQPPAQPIPTEPNIEVAPTLLPKPAPVQKTQPKKEQFDINNIVAMLDKKQTAPTVRTAKPGAQNVKGIGAQTAMTVDLVDALRSQIMACWSPPVGAPKGANLVVDFDLFLNPDGSVAQPPQLTANSRSAAGDPYARAAAEAARRAIYTCAPYRLPANRYAQWREINPFHFDPSQMTGQ